MKILCHAKHIEGPETRVPYEQDVDVGGRICFIASIGPNRLAEHISYFSSKGMTHERI